jgi:type I restriction enzyme, S subunit
LDVSPARCKYYDGPVDARWILKAGDVVVAMTDLKQDAPILGAAGVVPPSGRYLHNQRIGRVVVRDPGRLAREFVPWLLNSPAVRARVRETATGATVRHTAPVRIAEARACLPGLRTQRRIAAVLRSFDDLIAINERRIEFLDGLARSLYREWFVRFRFPGHEDTEFVESELGRIPANWRVRCVAEMTSQLTRGVAPRYADDGSWLVVNQRCIRDQRVSLAHARRQERDVTEAKQVRFGDVLINSTGVGTLGRVAMFLLGTQHVTADSHVTIVRPRLADMQAWLGLALRARQAEFEAMGTGSTGQTELSRQSIGDLRVCVPDETTLEVFSMTAWPLLTAVPELAQFNDRLSAARDLLLPRLITGRLDISDVDLAGLLADQEA